MASTDVLICGAGIAGIATAYQLAVQHGVRNVTLVDERPPLTLTSDKSTECYRNWWPGPGDAMVRLMNRSIDLLEALAHESGNIFLLNRRGYAYATADPARAADFRRAAEEAAGLGAGPLRIHAAGAGEPAYVPSEAEGFADQPTGTDLILDTRLIREHFGYLAEETLAVLHTRRCGWFSAQQMGMYLLERARERGVRLIRARVTGVDVSGGQVAGVRIDGPEGGQTISTPCFVDAAGPLVAEVARLAGVELPVFSELHTKVAFADHAQCVPRHAPLLIWADPQRVPWTEAERAELADFDDMRWMLDPLPEGVHTRPEGPPGSPMVLMLWDYGHGPVEPVIPPEFDPAFPDLVLRGLSTMLPALRTYFGRAPRPIVDGGYYTKTRENRPLIGPLPVDGAFVLGALAGYGLMAAPAAGELLAAQIAGGSAPDYAPAFSLSRYDDPQYQRLLENWGSTGQL